MGAKVAIHRNPGLKHQARAADAIAEGFRRHGCRPTVTASVGLGADIHVCLGPWYALRQNIGKRVLYLDRAFWGDPDCWSCTWLDKAGRKQFEWLDEPPKRQHPDLGPARSGDRSIYLCDYQCGPPADWAGSVRRHPAEAKSAEPLKSVLDRHDIAVGRHTTALVDAAIMGLGVTCEVQDGPCSGLYLGREAWIGSLAWHNWNHDEMSSGDMWEHFRWRF